MSGGALPGLRGPTSPPNSLNHHLSPHGPLGMGPGPLGMSPGPLGMGPGPLFQVLVQQSAAGQVPQGADGRYLDRTHDLIDCESRAEELPFDLFLTDSNAILERWT